MLDLVLPLECGGCGAPSTRWCDACARDLRFGPTSRTSSRHACTPGRARLLPRPLRGRSPQRDRRGQGARPRRPDPAARRRAERWPAAATDVGCARHTADHRPGTDPPAGRPQARWRPRHSDGVGGDSGNPGREGRPGASDEGPGPRLGRAVQHGAATQCRRPGPPAPALSRTDRERCWWSTTSSPPAPPPPNRCAPCKLPEPVWSPSSLSRTPDRRP